MKFLVLAYGDEKAWMELPKGRQDELLAQDRRLRERGAIVEALGPATTVRAWDGTPSTTAGPFSQSKLPLAGFGFFEARDLAEAIELVAKTPCAVAKGAVELWPVRDLEHE